MPVLQYLPTCHHHDPCCRSPSESWSRSCPHQWRRAPRLHDYQYSFLETEMILILKSGVVLTISPVPGSWESVGVPHQTTLLHQRIKSQQPSSVQSALSDRVMPVTRYIREHILVIILQHFLSSKLTLDNYLATQIKPLRCFNTIYNMERPRKENQVKNQWHIHCFQHNYWQYYDLSLPQTMFYSGAWQIKQHTCDEFYFIFDIAKTLVL